MPYRNDTATAWLVSGATLSGVALALLWSLAIATPAYVSKAEILVRPAAAPAFDGAAGGGGDVNPGHERELVHSSAVAELVRRRLGTTATVAELGRRVGVTVVGGTRILDLTFRAPTPSQAHRGAAAYADAYLELKRRQVEAIRNEQRAAIHSALEPIEEDLSSAQRRLGAVAPASAAGAAARAAVDDLSAQADPYRQNLAQTDVVDPGDVGAVVSPATMPGRPVRPRPLLDALLGAVAGLAVGAALAFGRARVDRRLQGRADLEEHLGAPVLATVPRVRRPRIRRRRAGAPPVTVEPPDGRTSDAYRALRVRLLALARKRPLKTVLVAGPAGDTGSTAVAANLAASLAEAGKEVTLVASGTAAAEVAGSLPPEEMRDLLAELGEGSDLVVVEGPGVLDTAQSLALAPMVDAVLVVAAVRSTTRDDVVLARQQLDQVGADVVGGVLSNARTPGPI